jgi:ABC-type glycerol-3-phosphate transport system substrate-binding protein
LKAAVQQESIGPTVFVKSLRRSTMSRSKMLIPVTAVVILAVLLGGCGPAPTPEVIREEVEVTRIVEKEGETVVEEVVVTATPLPPEEQPVNLVVWSHFATEPAKQAGLNPVFEGYMAEHPNVTIEVVWWDKAAMFDAYRAVMQAGGVGAPDLVYYDSSQIDWLDNGWLLNIEDLWDPDNFVAGLEKDPSWPYVIQFVGGIDIILYNPDIFAELGIEVPDGYQFTQDEFMDVVKTCKAAGYSPLADAIGDRPYPGQYLPRYALLNLVGGDEFSKYIAGEQSWDTPEVREILEWTVELREAGIWPPVFSSMGIDETHLYFHTQRQACMLFIGNWYTGRAFKAMEDGGQDPDWHIGMLKYPLMDGTTAPNAVKGWFGSGYGIVPTGENIEVAKDFLKWWSENPKYGAIWAAYSFMASGVKYTPEDLPEEVKSDPELAKWSWWGDTIAEVYGDAEVVLEPSPCGDFNDALTTVLNEGLPLGLFTVDEAIEYLDAHLCTQ